MVLRTRRETLHGKLVLSVYGLVGHIERGRVRLGSPHPETGFVEESSGYRFVPLDGSAPIEARTLALLRRRLAGRTIPD